METSQRLNYFAGDTQTDIKPEIYIYLINEMIGIHGIILSRLRKTTLFERFLAYFKINDSVETENIRILPNGVVVKISIKKFMDEKIFAQNGDYFICLDGFILNYRCLLNEFKARDMYELISKLFELYGYSFPIKLRGSFVGLLYFPKENKLLLFNDQVSTRPVYYFYEDDILAFSNGFFTLSQIMRELGYTPTLNVDGAYCLLTFGHMLGDLTLISGVKRLSPGTTLIYDGGALQLHKYHEFTDSPTISASEEEIIYGLAKRISQAVYLEYIKDAEYGYKHLATLSGGLDSRVCVAFAKNRFKSIKCLTYSQSNYLDQKIASKICRDNGFEHEFFPLEWGDHLINYADDVIHITGGLVSYLGFCNPYIALNKLDLRDYGLLHTGILGGEMLGEYCTSWRKGYDGLRYFIVGAKSSELLPRISKIVDKELLKYRTVELFKFHNIGINAQCTNVQGINQFIDTTSPYLYLDFLEYSMKIPSHYKQNKRVYVKMVNQYLGKFSWYTWEKYRTPPKLNLNTVKGYNLVLILINRLISKFSPYYSMNPFEYYYRKNEFLKNGFHRIFHRNINLLKNHGDLMSDCTNLFLEGNFLEKAAVITLLKVMKILGLRIQD